jgi:hypothetical protein
MGSDHVPRGDHSDSVGCKSAAACFRRSDGDRADRGDLVAFAHQVGEFGLRDEGGCDEEFEPIRRLVGFGLPSRSRSRIGRVHPSVLDDAPLVEKVGPRARSARISIVGSDGRGRAKLLFAGHVGCPRGGQRFGQLDDPQGGRRKYWERFCLGVEPPVSGPEGGGPAGCKSRAPKPAAQPTPGAAADLTLYVSNQSAARTVPRVRLTDESGTARDAPNPEKRVKGVVRHRSSPPGNGWLSLLSVSVSRNR